jgi:D-beta-D-heptose 7-phosphate kinase/D-beta-D-heptose 1-phosphate adenosyltransferase
MTEIINPLKRGNKQVIPAPGDELQLLYSEKIRNPMMLGNTLQSLKVATATQGARRLRIGFANGKFRYLHPAHVVFLSLCKTRCDILIVGINGDHSLRELGTSSPFNSKQRAFAIASLDVVDYVVSFNEDSPWLCIQSLAEVDVVFKGPDYLEKDVISCDKDVEIIMHPLTDIHATDLDNQEKKIKFFDL